MIGWLHDWIEYRCRIRRRWQTDARMLCGQQPRTAYCEARRRAARARAGHDADGFWHWSKVTAEVARICLSADMDLESTKRVVDRELDRS